MRTFTNFHRDPPELPIGTRVTLREDTDWSDSSANPVYDGRFGKVVGTLVANEPAHIAGLIARVQWDNLETNSYYWTDLDVYEEPPVVRKPYIKQGFREYLKRRGV